MSVTAEEFRSRREKVLGYIQELAKQHNLSSTKFILASGEEKNFSNDVHYPFRVDSNFYYLTGFTEPNAILVLDPTEANPFSMYLRPRNPKKEIWDGPRQGLEGVVENFAVDKAMDIAQFENDHNKETYANLEVSNTRTFHENILEFIASLRTIKSKAEIALMQKSNDIAQQAHRVAAEMITAGVYEYEIEAALHNVFRASGANSWAYPSIVASGKNSCILHYINNNKRIEKGDLVLIDAGAEYQMYASDITRVIAADGKFTKEQQDIYDLTLAAQEAAIASVQPGANWSETHEITTAVIGEGLADLGYIKDKHDPSQIQKYFMHGTGHSLGIDVHDCGISRKSSKYVPGMVTTIEPGIYIAEKSIGVRIEDNILVTQDGNENLTEMLIK